MRLERKNSHANCEFKFTFEFISVIFFQRFTNSNLNLFELIHLNKNMKTKETKNQTSWFFENSLQYSQKKAASITCVYYK